MRLLVFSDGHIGEYPEGRILPDTQLNSRLIDTLYVWEWIFHTAVQEQVDVVLFAGDRFRPKRPPVWMRDLADSRIRPFLERQIPVVIIVGNHDQWDLGRRWDTYTGIHTWRTATDPIWVYSRVGIWRGPCGIQILCIPYGSTPEEIASVQRQISPTDPTVVAFHDTVAGCSALTASGIMAPGHVGLPRDILDREDYTLVLGGHIHLAQTLPFRHTAAYHIGTPLERIEDGQQGEKGAWIIDVATSSTNTVTVQRRFVQSPLPRIAWITISPVHDKSEDAVVESIHTHLTAYPPQQRLIPAITLQCTRSVSPTYRRAVESYIRSSSYTAWDIRYRLQPPEQPKYRPDSVTEDSERLPAQKTIQEECLAWARATFPTQSEEFFSTLVDIISTESA